MRDRKKLEGVGEKGRFHRICGGQFFASVA